MKKFLIVLCLAFLLVSCAAQKPVDYTAPNVTQVACVMPETDNSYAWSLNSCVEISTRVFTLTVRVADEIANHTETNAYGTGGGYMAGGYGSYSSSFRMWQDGKGILPVVVVSMSPEFHSLAVGDTILLKTSDLKAMALPVGGQADFICNEDVEVLSPNQSGQVLTTDRLTYELDDCRMVTPEFVGPAPQE